MAGTTRDPVDPDGLLEYSVVYTDRSLNHMSRAFQQVMRDLSTRLKGVHNADATVVLPGSGTFAMESVARQFARGRRCLVVRNGWFSYRWSQILEMSGLPAAETVLRASRTVDAPEAPFAPAPVEEVEARIREERPDLVLAPHVDTASGILLPDDYLRRIASAVHEVGGLLVLDAVASGALWVDLDELGVDVLVSAPQKGWTGTPCCGLVLLGGAARKQLEETASDSFAMDLRRWLGIMEAYEGGGHAYHATLPTDGLRQLRDVTDEAADYGFDRLRSQQEELGRRVRARLAEHGFASVAAEGYEAPGVVVCYTSDPGLVGRFAEAGLQVAGGVPLMCGEPDDYRAFRIGLFGLDKLYDVDGTVDRLERALQQLASR